jgi:hypothetical protein
VQDLPFAIRNGSLLFAVERRFWRTTHGSRLKRFAVCQYSPILSENGKSKATNSALKSIQRNPFYPALASIVRTPKIDEDWPLRPLFGSYSALKGRYSWHARVVFSKLGYLKENNSALRSIWRNLLYPDLACINKPPRVEVYRRFPAFVGGSSAFQ